MLTMRWGILALAFSVPCVFAAGDEGKAALAKSQFMLRQITAEKTQLESKNKELEQANAQLKTQVEKLQKDLTARNELIAQWQNKVQEQQQTLTQTQQQYTAQQRELQRSAQMVSHQKSNIENRLSAQRGNLRLCMDNNRKLYDINKELLGKYEGKGFWAVVKHQEPFTGKQQVEVEKLVQEYQYQMDDAIVVEQDIQ
jgi:multidrug efflux pump subunit AcrA (membrane-fusion protein)